MSIVQTTVTCWVFEVECSCGAKAPREPRSIGVQHHDQARMDPCIADGDLFSLHDTPLPKGWSRAWIEIPDADGMVRNRAVYFCPDCRDRALQIAGVDA